MKLWLDAHLPPKLVPWLRRTFDLEATAIRDLDLRQAKDRQIFDEARRHGTVVMTKTVTSWTSSNVTGLHRRCSG